MSTSQSSTYDLKSTNLDGVAAANGKDDTKENESSAQLQIKRESIDFSKAKSVFGASTPGRGKRRSSKAQRYDALMSKLNVEPTQKKSMYGSPDPQSAPPTMPGAEDNDTRDSLSTARDGAEPDHKVLALEKECNGMSLPVVGAELATAVEEKESVQHASVATNAEEEAETSQNETKHGESNEEPVSPVVNLPVEVAEEESELPALEKQEHTQEEESLRESVSPTAIGAVDETQPPTTCSGSASSSSSSSSSISSTPRSTRSMQSVQEWSSGRNGFKKATSLKSAEEEEHETFKINMKKTLFQEEDASGAVSSDATGTGTTTGSDYSSASAADTERNTLVNIAASTAARNQQIQVDAIVSSAQVFTTKFRCAKTGGVESAADEETAVSYADSDMTTHNDNHSNKTDIITTTATTAAVVKNPNNNATVFNCSRMLVFGAVLILIAATFLATSLPYPHAAKELQNATTSTSSASRATIDPPVAPTVKEAPKKKTDSKKKQHSKKAKQTSSSSSSSSAPSSVPHTGPLFSDMDTTVSVAQDIASSTPSAAGAVVSTSSAAVTGSTSSMSTQSLMKQVIDKLSKFKSAVAKMLGGFLKHPLVALIFNRGATA